MAALSKNWITERHIDFEYKKYLLLAYLQEVGKHFNAAQLYPWLAELIDHYRNTVSIKENKLNLKKLFPKRLSQIDGSGQLTFDHLVNDDELMLELESIIEYAIPQMQQKVEEGKSIYDIAEEHITIQPVGLIPLNPAFGYMFIKAGKTAITNVYEYQLTIFENTTEKFKAIHTHYIKSVSKTISTTFQSMKSDLLRENKSLSNPATYSVETEMRLPLEETLLPIAKRMLVKHISQEETRQKDS